MSQLYSVLHRLVDQGWADVKIELQEGRPPRHTYSVTAKGRRAFWRWACMPVAHPRDLRVVFLAKVYFLRKLRPAAVGKLVDAQEAELGKALAALEERATIASDDVAVATAARAFRATHVKSALRWLNANRTLLESVREDA